MQCYERQMMFIMLYNHVKAEDPEISFDRLLLSRVLEDFGITSILQMIDLEEAEWKIIINRFERYVEPAFLHSEQEDEAFYHARPLLFREDRHCA